MATNVVSAVRSTLVKAIKAGDTTVQPPSKWATQAGFSGSAASPLRAHMARVSGNGCGRQARYPAVSAEELMALLDLADAFVAAEGNKREATAKRIHNKLYPAAKSGGRAAKAKASTAKAKPKAAPKAKATA